MDNTKKRKIVRNFVIGYLIIQVLTIVVYLGFWSLHPEGITNVTNERMSPPPIFPGSPDKPGGLSIQLCKSEKKEFYIRYSS